MTCAIFLPRHIFSSFNFSFLCHLSTLQEFFCTLRRKTTSTARTTGDDDDDDSKDNNSEDDGDDSEDGNNDGGNRDSSGGGGGEMGGAVSGVARSVAWLVAVLCRWLLGANIP